MPRYTVNKNAQANGDHEVHDMTISRSCHPASFNQLDLGLHSTCSSAVQAAKRHYARSNGCANCAPACHTS